MNKKSGSKKISKKILCLTLFHKYLKTEKKKSFFKKKIDHKLTSLGPIFRKLAKGNHMTQACSDICHRKMSVGCIKNGHGGE